MTRRFVILFMLLALISCKKEKSELKLLDPGYNYFPLITGATSYYFIERISIDKLSNYYDTVSYYLKIVVDTSYLDVAGNTVFPIERYIADSLGDPWEIHDVWNAWSNQAMSVMTEENIKYVKIRYPVAVDNQWDGNVYNVIGRQDYTITAVDVSYTLNNLTFDSVLTVTHKDSETMINKYLTKENYAKNKGLIEYYKLEIDYAQPLYGIPIEQRIERGTIFRQVLIEI